MYMVSVGLRQIVTGARRYEQPRVVLFAGDQGVCEHAGIRRHGTLAFSNTIGKKKELVKESTVTKFFCATTNTTRGRIFTTATLLVRRTIGGISLTLRHSRGSLHQWDHLPSCDREPGRVARGYNNSRRRWRRFRRIHCELDGNDDFPKEKPRTSDRQRHASLRRCPADHPVFFAGPASGRRERIPAYRTPEGGVSEFHRDPRRGG